MFEKIKKKFSTENLKVRAEKRKQGGRANRFAAFGIDHFIQLFTDNFHAMAMHQL